MSTELQDALARASQVAKAEFETRNAVDVIHPAARRVARQRAGLRLGAGLATVAVIGGVLWTADTIANSRATGIDPAGPGVATVAPDDNPDVVTDSGAWSTLDLAVRALPRQQGSVSVDGTAGAICHHAVPQDDPRIAAKGDDLTVSHHTVFEDCRATWFLHGPATTLSDWHVTQVATNTSPTLMYSFSIHNDSPQPIMFDEDSLFMWIETDPDGSSNTMTTYDHTVLAGSMWDAMGNLNALLTSETDPVTIPVDGTYTRSLTATTGSADGDALATMLSTDSPYRLTLWARVHENNPSGDATYLIQLGADNDARWVTSSDISQP
jgi:hypothetical protein